MTRTAEKRIGFTDDRFMELYRLLIENNDYFKAGPVKTPPYGTDKGILRELEELLRASSKELPPEYQKGFSQPLMDNLASISNHMLMKYMQPNGTWGFIFFSNAVMQSASTSGFCQSVKRLQAVIADIYTSFLYSDERVSAGLTPKQRLPPLGAFTAPILPKQQVSPPPYMFSVDMMKELSNRFAAGVVSLPSGYRTHPILWGVLAHEVGGHDVLHADEDLLPELLKGIEDLFTGSQKQILGELWRFWGEEAAADACGVLNLGPAYGLGAIVYHTVIVHIASKPEEHKEPDKPHHPPFLDTKPLPLPGDSHPISALIPYLIIGAIEQLTTLKPATIARYISQVDELAKMCTLDRGPIDLTKYWIKDDKGLPKKVGETFPLETLIESARAVGRHIVSTKFASLKGKGFQDYETWDDADERTAQRIAEALEKGEEKGEPLESIKQDNGKDVEDAQILAAAILAVFRKPADYGRINVMIGKAFDHSYDTDPLIHGPQ